MTHDTQPEPNLDVREAETADVEAVRAVARDAWAAAYDWDREAVADAVDDWYDRAALSDLFAEPRTAFLVADRAGEVLGFCHAVFEPDRADVLRIYVRPADWRAGVGTALHDAVVTRARERDLGDLRAMVLADNDVGRGFYEALGYGEVDADTTAIAGEEYAETVYTRSI